LTDTADRKARGERRHGPRKSTLALTVVAIGLVAIGLMFTHARCQSRADRDGIAAVRAVVADLGLTDLALFTEARYTRHLSQADGYSAFQDHPVALDHFPSGSLAPPAGLRRHHDPLD
jgi:hypothetical protein